MAPEPWVWCPEAGCGGHTTDGEARGWPLGHRRTGLGVSTGLGEGDGSRGGSRILRGEAQREEDGTGGTCCKESEVTGSQLSGEGPRRCVLCCFLTGRRFVH